MIDSKSNLLRRTFAALTAATFAFIAVQASALTVSLSGIGQCTYSAMTVQPDGNVIVTCESTSPPPAAGNFSLSGPTANVNIGATGTIATVTRTGGTAGAVTVAYAAGSVTNSCSVVAGNLGWADTEGGSKTIAITIPTTIANVGQCTVAISVGAPGGSGITQISFLVVDPNAPVSNCPTPPATAVAMTLAFGGAYTQPRMASGQIGYYPLIANPNPAKASIYFTQGQQPVSPGGTITEFSVSKCPGVIDTTVPQCYYKSAPGFLNNNQILMYTRPIFSYSSQATLGNQGCWAPIAQGPWYVNVRWTFASCQYGASACGFTHQWAGGPY